MPNVAPVVSSISFDKPSYVPGQEITATVTYVEGSRTVADNVSAVVTDPTTSLTGTLTGTLDLQETDPCTVAFSDASGRTWTPGATTATTAVFTATA